MISSHLKIYRVFYIKMDKPIFSKSIYNIKSEKKQIFSKAIKIVEPKKPKKPKVEYENQEMSEQVQHFDNLHLDDLKIDKLSK